MKYDQHLLEVIDAFPINEIVNDHSIDARKIIDWFGNAKKIGDLDILNSLDDYESEIPPYMLTWDICFNQSIFEPMSVAVLKQSLLLSMPLEYPADYIPGIASFGAKQHLTRRWLSVYLTGCSIMALRTEEYRETYSAGCHLSELYSSMLDISVELMSKMSDK